MKGKGIAKASRRFTDEDRRGKKRLKENITAAIIKGELDEDKIAVKSDEKDEKQL